MKTRLGSRYVATVLLALLVLVPVSVSYAGNQRVEKFIELAERAGEKTGTLINITYANATAMTNLEDNYNDLYLQFMDNKILFETFGLGNLTAAREAETSEEKIANATQALEIFREVYKAIHTILAEANIQKGQLLDAQGLIRAMQRALDRIQRLEEIEDLPDATRWILGNATLYLNVTLAIEQLQVGMVNETTYNMTQANKLISLAHSTLQKKAAALKTQRVDSYFKVIKNLYNRLNRSIDRLAGGEGKDYLKGLLGTALTHIENAEGAEDEQALGELAAARNILEEVEQGLKEQRRQSGNGKGTGNGNGNGKGKGKGNGED